MYFYSFVVIGEMCPFLFCRQAVRSAHEKKISEWSGFKYSHVFIK